MVVGAARWVRCRTRLGRMPRKRVARAVAASARAAGKVTRRLVGVSAMVSVDGAGVEGGQQAEVVEAGYAGVGQAYDR